MSAETEETAGAIRKRVRVVSSWNGKKVYLDEFYGILKQAIDETELLIQQKDRELFEDILSQTISRQLTDRIAESRKWVSDMSKLMKEMDTSMGLIFSLDWKPGKAENDMELDTAELEQILLRDHTFLTIEDIKDTVRAGDDERGVGGVFRGDTDYHPGTPEGGAGAKAEVPSENLRLFRRK